MLARGIAMLLVELTLGAIVAPSSSCAQAVPTPAQKAFLQKLNQPIILRGDYFKAVLVAYDDFSRKLAENESAGKLPTDTNPELARWLSKIEHYDIHVEQTKSTYIVQIGPTVREDAPTVFGGGERYVINRKSFRISEKTGLK